ncbi:MAG: hypothetical protein ACRDMJ_06295, partial [Solirubrobacteraceae bacterium]
RDATPEFEPLSAEVEAQLTLFGGPVAVSPAPARAGRAPDLEVGAIAPGDTRPLPAFERRSQLRDERHRLVSELRRRDGSSHQEINAWLNHRLGIASVEQATLNDLEQSVELLVRRLTRRR